MVGKRFKPYETGYVNIETLQHYKYKLKVYKKVSLQKY